MSEGDVRVLIQEPSQTRGKEASKSLRSSENTLTTSIASSRANSAKGSLYLKKGYIITNQQDITVAKATGSQARLAKASVVIHDPKAALELGLDTLDPSTEESTKDTAASVRRSGILSRRLSLRNDPALNRLSVIRDEDGGDHKQEPVRPKESASRQTLPETSVVVPIQEALPSSATGYRLQRRNTAPHVISYAQAYLESSLGISKSSLNAKKSAGSNTSVGHSSSIQSKSSESLAAIGVPKSRHTAAIETFQPSAVPIISGDVDDLLKQGNESSIAWSVGDLNENEEQTPLETVVSTSGRKDSGSAGHEWLAKIKRAVLGSN